jgi:opacity protein-like surface antigen
MRLRVWLVAAVVALIVTVMPASAHADIVLSPFAGIHFGGDAPDKPFTLGGSVTFVGRSLGLEIEASRTNDFFGDNTADVSLLTAALVGGADLPGTGIKPYFLAGAGLLRTNIEFGDILDDTSYNNFAILLGGGLNAYITDHVGLRGDVRYMRRLERQSGVGVIPIASNFDFWRATVGVNIRFF